MEINLLALNVGNSRLSMGAFVAGEIGEVTRIPHARRDQWAAHIGPQWDRIKLRDNAAIVAAGVNPPMQQALADAVEQATGRRVVWVGKDLDLPIKVLTESPEQTGVDRVLNVAAAYEQIGNACVVVDAGTAVTVDVCNDQGRVPRRGDRAGRAASARSAARRHGPTPAGRVPAPDAPDRRQHAARRCSTASTTASAGW